MRLSNKLRKVLILLQFEDYQAGRIELLKIIHQLELEQEEEREELEIELQFDSSLEGLEID